MPMPPTQSMTTEKLGQIIRRQRKAQNHTQATVSQHANISPRLVSELERGKGTVQVGLVLDLLKNLGLDLLIVPRNQRFTKEYAYLKAVMEGE